jgi:hypothetical protein
MFPVNIGKNPTGQAGRETWPKANFIKNLSTRNYGHIEILYPLKENCKRRLI